MLEQEPTAFRLSRLPSERVVQWWPDLAVRVRAACPPPNSTENPNAVNTVLAAVIEGQCQIWLWLRRSEGKTDVQGIVLTQRFAPTISSRTHLWIEGCAFDTPPTPEQFQEIMSKLKKFARACGCDCVVLMTDNKLDILAMAESLNANTEYRLLQFPVEV